MSGCEGYRALAGVYDLLNREIRYSGWADFFEACFSRWLPQKPELILDLACGTGRMTHELARRGYDMIGVDGSADMLSVAYATKPEGSGTLFLEQDMRSFELYGTVGAVTCCLDSLNYLLADGELLTCFKTVHNYLDPGGLFLFDMNTPYKHQKVLGDNAFTFEEEDASCVWRNHYNAADRRVEITVDIDYHETGEHFHEEFCEYTYDLDTIRAALEKHGFALESVCDGETFGPLTEESQRYFFCATKQYTQLEE